MVRAIGGGNSVQMSRTPTPRQEAAQDARQTATANARNETRLRQQNAELERDLAELEKQLNAQQKQINVNPGGPAQPGPSEPSFGTGTQPGTGVTPPADGGGSGGLLSSITGGGHTSWLILGGAVILIYFGYRAYKQRKGGQS